MYRGGQCSVLNYIRSLLPPHRLICDDMHEPKLAVAVGARNGMKLSY